MNKEFYLKTIERVSQPWEMRIEVDTDSFKEDSALIDEVSGHIRHELNEWEGVLWHHRGYNLWWWFDEAEMHRFIAYFTIKYSGRI